MVKTDPDLAKSLAEMMTLHPAIKDGGLIPTEGSPEVTQKLTTSFFVALISASESMEGDGEYPITPVYHAHFTLEDGSSICMVVNSATDVIKINDITDYSNWKGPLDGTPDAKH